MTERFDIAIVGAGMVGATVAAALRNTPLRVALLEAQSPEPYPSKPADYSVRVSAITCGSARILQEVGAWEGIVARRVSPFREMHVWDATGNGVIHFDSAEIGEPLLGYIIENRLIQTMLLREVQRADNVTWICPGVLHGMEIQAEAARLELDEGQRITARLVVGADGSDSRVRTFAGLQTRGWPYEQKAVVANVTTSGSHEETAWQRFMPDGPLAFLPLADGRSSIVWSTRPEDADALLALDEQEFLGALQKAFGDALGRMEAAGPRAAFALRMLHAEHYVARRVALVGDAAHTIHPLAGQGVNLGLADAAVLAQALAEGTARSVDPGSLKPLRRYERWRKGENLAMLGVMDGFKRLFGSRAPVVRLVRNLGLNVTNAAVPVKHALMRRAMGLEARGYRHLGR